MFRKKFLSTGFAQSKLKVKSSVKEKGPLRYIFIIAAFHDNQQVREQVRVQPLDSIYDTFFLHKKALIFFLFLH